MFGQFEGWKKGDNTPINTLGEVLEECHMGLNEVAKEHPVPQQEQEFARELSALLTKHLGGSETNVGDTPNVIMAITEAHATLCSLVGIYHTDGGFNPVFQAGDFN